MKILLLTEFFPKSNSAEITGGVEARCYYVTRHLRGHHEVEVLATLTDGSAWEHASLSSLPRRLAFLVSAFFHGMRTDFDLVEGSNLVVYPVAWLVGFLRRKPVVFWYPDVLIGTWQQGSFRYVGALGEIVERVILKLPVQRYIAISQSTGDKLIAQGVDPANVEVVPCGFEPALVEEVLRQELPKRWTIAIVARLVSYKRVDLVLAAFAKLISDDRDVSLVVIGRGPEEEQLDAHTKALGIADRVEFRGYVKEHADVMRLMAQSRVLVSASEVEGFGIVLVEAMALGLPYVVANIPVFTEVSGNSTGGLYFRPGDSADLAAQLRRLLDNEEMYRVKSREAAQYAQRYTWIDIAQQSERVYQSVLATDGRHR